MREVFISYKSYNPALGNNDETVANELCQALEAAGITCWMAPRDIPFGSDYDDCIVAAIESCKVMVVVFSHNTLPSKYVYEEVRIAYDSEKDIIRFKLDNTQLKGKWNLRLGAKQWIDASDNYRRKKIELINALRRKLGKTDDRVTQNITIDAPTDSITIPVTPSVLNFTVNGVSFKMIRVEGSSFTMGATPEQGGLISPHKASAHLVTLSTYYIGETQVTQKLWQAVMVDNPSYFKGNQCPVENVSWNDCQEFISRLNQITGRSFRLPTEAEWEFAARGGNKSRGYKYSGSDNLDEVGWYKDNSGQMTHSVAKKAPNELGLFDMSGNVWEWCQDRYRSCRVIRGGGWGYYDKSCLVTARDQSDPDKGCYVIGFRLAL